MLCQNRMQETRMAEFTGQGKTTWQADSKAWAETRLSVRESTVPSVDV